MPCPEKGEGGISALVLSSCCTNRAASHPFTGWTSLVTLSMQRYNTLLMDWAHIGLQLFPRNIEYEQNCCTS